MPGYQVPTHKLPFATVTDKPLSSLSNVQSLVPLASYPRSRLLSLSLGTKNMCLGLEKDW